MFRRSVLPGGRQKTKQLQGAAPRLPIGILLTAAVSTVWRSGGSPRGLQAHFDGLCTRSCAAWDPWTAKAWSIYNEGRKCVPLGCKDAGAGSAAAAGTGAKATTQKPPFLAPACRQRIRIGTGGSRGADSKERSGVQTQWRRLAPALARRLATSERQQGFWDGLRWLAMLLGHRAVPGWNPSRDT